MAILVQNINRAKCIDHKVWFLQKFFDVRVALYSIKRDKIEPWVKTTCKDFFRTAIEQVWENSVAVCNASDKTVFLSIGSGAPPGLHTATHMFNSAYGDALSKYFRSIANSTQCLQAESFGNGEVLDMSSTHVVVDLCTMMASKNNTEILRQLTKFEADLDTTFGEYILEQNATKAAILCRFFGKGAIPHMRQM